jgi:hypothetical protein
MSMVKTIFGQRCHHIPDFISLCDLIFGDDLVLKKRQFNEKGPTFDNV